MNHTGQPERAAQSRVITSSREEMGYRLLGIGSTAMAMATSEKEVRAVLATWHIWPNIPPYGRTVDKA